MSRLRGSESGMRGVLRCAATLLVLCLSSSAFAQDSEGSGESRSSESEDGRAVIHFADLGGIEDWRVATDGSLLIEGRNKRWYRATFFGPCAGLRFVSTIGFVTDSTGDLDRFSSILVDGQRCYFRTLEGIEPPEVPISKRKSTEDE